MKLNILDFEAMRQALCAAHPRGAAHGYSPEDISEVAKWAELQLVRLNIPKKYWKGAAVSATSGEKVPNAYKYARTATTVKLKRDSSKWMMVDCRKTAIYQDGGKVNLILTPEQDALAVSALKKNYWIAA